ncbi:MAG: hypothetical protein AUH41_11870 [Gemmatimonadetes bacterium 13_1_40CM_66_11]|nr:MAG: hypothetical protein AUH41_11870 [Gemmatimonadetes bacterium 13_1_40CM_66_11]
MPTVTSVYLDQHGAGFLLDLGPASGIYDWRVNQAFHLRIAGKLTESDPDDSRSMMPFSPRCAVRSKTLIST